MMNLPLSLALVLTVVAAGCAGQPDVEEVPGAGAVIGGVIGGGKGAAIEVRVPIASPKSEP